MRTRKPRDPDAPIYQRNWFAYRNRETFEKFVKPLYAGKPCRYLEIGVFEGMGLRWMAENVLTHHESIGIGVDPWAATDKLSAEFMEDVRCRALHNLKQFLGIVLRKMSSDDYFTQHWLGVYFDLILIDGDHFEEPCYRDSVNSWACLKSGGHLLWDDYKNRTHKKHHVKQAVDRFLKEREGEWEPWVDYRFQLGVRKK